MTKIIKPIQSFLKIDEAIIYEDKLHFIELLFSFIYTSIGLAIGIWLCKYIEPNYVGYGVIFFVIVLEIYFLITYFTTSIVITNSRVFKKYGLIGNYTVGNQLTKIESIEIYQGIFDRFFGTFSVVVSGVGGDEKKSFGSLLNAQTFYKKLQEAVDGTMSTVKTENDKITQRGSYLEDEEIAKKLAIAGKLLIEVSDAISKK